MNRRLFFLLCVMVPVIWTAPVITGYLTSAGTDSEFLGWIRSDDFHRYGCFIDQTAEKNQVIYKDYSTVRPQNPRMIAVFFTVLGCMKKATGLPAQYLWIASGVIVGTLFAWFLFHFLSYWLPDRQIVWTAWSLILFSGGLDWMFLLGGKSLPRPRNAWMDGFSTFDTFHNPLKIAGLLMGLWLGHEAMRLLESWSPARLVKVGFLVLLAWAIHPNSAIPAYTGLFTCAVIPLSRRIPWRRWIRWSPLVIPFLIILLYIQWMKTDPMTANIIRQYRVPFAREPLTIYPIRYGLILLLGLDGMARRIRSFRSIDLYLAGWLGGALFFSNWHGLTGLLFQHMIHLPLAYFAAVSLNHLFLRFPRSKKLLAGSLLCLFLAGHAFWITRVCKQTAGDVWPTSLYVSRDAIPLMEGLKELPPGNVLVNRDTGNKITWLALHNVFLGHWGTTPNKTKKEKELRRFYAPDTSAAWRRAFLARYNIRYIWYGPTERKLGDIPRDPPLRLVRSEGAFQLFEVLPEPVENLQGEIHENRPDTAEIPAVTTPENAIRQ